MFGPGEDVSTAAWAHGPARSRFGQRSPAIPRSAMFVYPSAHPVTSIVAASIEP